MRPRKWSSSLCESLPLLSGRQVLAALTRLGFAEIHRKGSHVKMEHPDARGIVFPFQAEIDRYTLKGALRDADVDLAEFLDQVR
jgi:predicted RNA binding protein YcfA (HicA-like mRNA interferase family)